MEVFMLAPLEQNDGSWKFSSHRPMKMWTFATDSGRLEAFSDGVMAVIITIMVLELKPPQGTHLEALRGTLLQLSLIAVNGRDGALAQAVATDVKGKGSLVFYLAAIGFAFVSPVISDGLFICVALIWFIPDRRMERAILDTAA